MTTRGLVDTSVFIAREADRPLAVDGLPDELAVSIVSVAELRAGVLAATDVSTRDRRLITLTEALRLDPVPIDDDVAQAWARLRVALRDASRRMTVNDTWIAATALALGVPLVSQDRDYSAAPDLEVLAL